MYFKKKENVENFKFGGGDFKKNPRSAFWPVPLFVH
jgi:hypothetical protein